MNRLLLVVNALLALFLAIRLATTGHDVAAGEGSERAVSVTWSAADVRVVPTPPERGQRVLRMTVDFGRELAPETFAKPLESAPSEAEWPVDAERLGLRLEPKAELLACWRSARLLELAVPTGLPAARHCQLHFAHGLRAADGRTLPAGTAVAFATPTVSVERVLLQESEQPGQMAALLVRFDQPVALAALQARLQVLRRDHPEPVPVTITAEPSADGGLFRVVPLLDAAVRAIALVIQPGLVPQAGEIGTAGEFRRAFNLSEPLALAAAEASDGGIELTFNRAVKLPDAASIELEPAVPFQVFQGRMGLRLVGAFPPGEVLAVRLKAGFPGSGSERSRLAEGVRRSLLLPDLEAALDFARAGSVLSVRAEPVLEVSGTNIAGFQVRARRVYPNNIVRMVQNGDSESMAPAKLRDFAVAAARNQRFTERIDLAQLLGEDAPRGLYRIELKRDGEWWPKSRLVQLTDLGVTVRAAADAVAVQVVSIADGGAVAGALVRVLSPTNQLLAEGAVDDRGTALLRWGGKTEDRRPLVVCVRTASDEAFVDLRGNQVELADPTLGGRPFAGDLPEAYVWPTRGIARPGETIDAAVLLRAADASADAGRTVTVAFEAPNGRAFQRQRLVTPGSGLLHVSLATSTDVPIGTWQVVVRDAADGPELGRAAVQVEAFVPNRLEADVAVAASGLRFGSAGEVTVQGRWLDGTPAAGRPVTVRVQLVAGEFRLATAPEFHFVGGADQPTPGELPSQAAVLDASGAATVRFPLPADAPQQTLIARLIAEVEDPSGRVVRAVTEAPVLRPGLHLGVRAGAADVELRAVHADGSPWTEPVPFTVRLERRRWEWNYATLGGDRWRWDTTVASTVLGEWHGELRAGAANQAMTFARDSGWLVVVASAGGVQAEWSVDPKPQRPDRLRVRGPAEPVEPGATARLLVDAPAAGRGFVTLEGPTLLAVHVVDLVRGDNEIFLPIPWGLRLPNVHALVTLTRPARSVGPDAGPAWLVGGAALTLQRSDAVTAVTLRCPGSVEPEASLACEVSAPGASSALVAVVDEGVLAITRHGSPDPVGWLLGSRRLAASGADLFAALMQGARYAPGTKTGGDGDDLPSMLAVGAVSPRIRPLALVAEVALDANGRGTAAFKLPAYEGRVRVMVLAAGPAGFGAAAADTIVQAPLGLQAVAPRMVAPGDRFAVPVTLRNASGVAGTVVLAMVAENGLELAETAELSVPLAVAATATVDVWLRALDAVAGRVPTLRLTARLGAQERHLALELQVRELRLLEQEFLGLPLQPGSELQLGADFAAEGFTGELQADPTPDRMLRPALEAMLQYPYGCVEQTTSRGLVLLSCAALLDRIYQGEHAAPNAAALTQIAVDRLCGMQNWRGGFGWWPGEESEFSFGTVYAADFLLAARDAGLPVPAAALQSSLARVEGVLLSTAPVGLRVFACEVLSRAGAPVKSRAQWLADQVQTGEDRAVLAIALARLGESDRARAMLAAPTVAVAVDATTPARTDSGLLRSPLRERALVLRARLAVSASDPLLPGLVVALQQELLRPERLTTQELGQGLRALAEWYRGRAGAGPAVVVGTLDGVPLPPAVGGRIALAAPPGAVLRLQPGSQGFGLVTLRGFRKLRQQDGDGSLSLRRVIVDLATGVEATSFRRGHLYEVRLIGNAARSLDQVVLVDLLPGGLEAEAPPPGTAVAGNRRGHQSVRIERRDDRVLLFPQGNLQGEFEFVHLVRATFPGAYSALPPMAQAMYDPAAAFTGQAGDGLEIRP